MTMLTYLGRVAYRAPGRIDGVRGFRIPAFAAMMG